MSEVVPFTRKAACKTDAATWEGILRMMEANGRTKVEISIAQVRDIVEAFRRAEA